MNLLLKMILKNSYLKLHESILYQFNTLKISYYILRERYEILDENDNLLIVFYFNVLSKGVIIKNIHIFKNTYYYKIKNDINKLKIKVYLKRIESNNTISFSVKLINSHQSNFVVIEYLKYNV